MNSITKTLMLLAVMGVIIFGCEYANSPQQTEQKQVSQLYSLSDTTLLGFSIHYNGRTYANGNTTFSYQVSGPAVNMHFRIGYPTTNCSFAPTSWSPGDGTTSNNDCCVNPGLEWHPSTGSGPFAFTYTFAGNVGEAPVAMSIKTTSSTEVGRIMGPDVPRYEISGNVFQDASRDGILDASETGIGNVTLNLKQGSTVVGTTTSGTTGTYSFPNLVCGTYTVEVDTLSLTGTQSTYFQTTTVISRTVTVGPNSTGNNFGFQTNNNKLKVDLKSGTLPTTGFTANFWKKQVQTALAGRTATYSPDSVLAFIARIEGYALVDPYLFPSDPNGKLQRALDLLSRPTHTSLEKLIRELLALEFNHAARKGIDLSTQLVLIGWGESLVGPIGSTARPFIGTPQGDGPATDVEDALIIFGGIDKSSGGGAVGGEN